MKKPLAELNGLPSPRAAVEQELTLRQLTADLQDGCYEMMQIKAEAESVHERALKRVQLQGQMLIKIKEQVGHGNFRAWIKKHLSDWATRAFASDKKDAPPEWQISHRTATNWMRAAMWADEHKQLLSQLRSVAQLYMLAGILPDPGQPEIKTEPAFSLAIAMRYIKPLKRLNVDQVRGLPPGERDKVLQELEPIHELYLALSRA